LSGFVNEQRRELLQQILDLRTRYLTVVLEDIYQTQNASAVVRSAECLGLREIHIIENRNEYQINPKVVKGSSKWIKIKRYNNSNNNTENCLASLKQKEYKIVAMTLNEDAILLDQLSLEDKTALCFGSEDTGLSSIANKMTDYHIKVPMCGFTQSFNISVSAGIALYSLSDKLRRSTNNWQLESNEKDDLYLEWLVKSTPNGRLLLKNFLEKVVIN